MADYAQTSTLETESGQTSKKPNKCELTTTKWILIVIAAVILTALITNMDRMVASGDDDDSSSSPSTDSSTNSNTTPSPSQSPSQSPTQSYDNEYDIVIIGAGVTGLLHSYFLSTEAPETYSTLTIERYNRLCGRTHSVDIKHNESSSFFETGAMRFYYNEMQQQLFKQLNLCGNVIPLDDTLSFFSSNPDAYYVYRNHRKRQGDINETNYWQKVYNLNPKEAAWIATDYDPAVEIGYKEILDENGGVAPSTDEEWDDFWNTWTLRGIPVRDWSSYAFYKNVVNVSVEYYRSVEENYLYDRSVAEAFYEEYGPQFFDSLFAAPGVPHFPGLGLFTLDTGYDEVCKRLYDNASSYDSNDYWFEQNMIGIDYNYDANSDQYKYVVLVEDVYGRDEVQKVYTNNVVSTMSPLQLSYYLPYMTPINNEETRALVDTVSPTPCYKINFVYDSSFWIDYDLMDLTLARGTDMEIHGVYIESAWTNGTLTTFQFYTVNDPLWHWLQELGDPYENDEDLIVADEDEGNVLTSSAVLVDEMVKQLRVYLDIQDIPFPLAAFSSPLGYNVSNGDAYYGWKAGTIINDAMNDIIKPVEDEDVYIASSSYSPYQGWQYGCIWATIQNLQNNFDIDDPLTGDKCSF